MGFVFCSLFETRALETRRSQIKNEIQQFVQRLVDIRNAGLPVSEGLPPTHTHIVHPLLKSLSWGLSVLPLSCSLTAPRTISILIAFTMYLKHWRHRKKGRHTCAHTQSNHECPLLKIEPSKMKASRQSTERQTDRSREHLVIIPMDELPLAGLSYPPQPPFSIILPSCR